MKLTRPDLSDYKGDGAGQDYQEDLHKYIDHLEAMLKQQVEVCISCGSFTTVPILQDVSIRHHYVEGAGQLCADCWQKIYEH